MSRVLRQRLEVPRLAAFSWSQPRLISRVQGENCGVEPPTWSVPVTGTQLSLGDISKRIRWPRFRQLDAARQAPSQRGSFLDTARGTAGMDRRATQSQGFGFSEGLRSVVPGDL